MCKCNGDGKVLAWKDGSAIPTVFRCTCERQWFLQGYWRHVAKWTDEQKEKGYTLSDPVQVHGMREGVSDADKGRDGPKDIRVSLSSMPKK